MYPPFSDQFLVIAVDIGGIPECAAALESSVEDLTSCRSESVMRRWSLS